MAANISDAVREVCLSLPEAKEVVSRGSPDYRVRGRTFATYVVNHHGDGRVALWLAAPPGAQRLHTERDAERYFVPPYVGPRGWLGVRLDRGLDWRRVAERVREAYLTVAPSGLAARAGPAIEIEPPTESVPDEEFDRLSAPHVRESIEHLRGLCLALPETSETTQFGNPVWRAGRKSFCTAYRYTGRLALSFWVGPDLQDMLTLEERFSVPAYLGHHGWIALDAEEGVDWREVEELVLTSYRHFALKRMLKALCDGA